MHDKLSAHRVVDAGAEEIGLRAKELAHPDRRVDPACRRDTEARWEERGGEDVRLTPDDAGLESGHR
jgi:hypothetical protein